jgi:hypothetical protein
LVVTGTIRITGGNPDTNDILTAIDSSGNATWSSVASVLSTTNGVTGSGTTNYFPYWKSSNNLAATSSLYYVSGNNLGILAGSSITWQDLTGVTPSSPNSKIRWSFSSDYAEIFAWQPTNVNQTDLVFKLADDAITPGNEEFIFWMVGQGEAEHQYPLEMNSGEFTINALRKYGTTASTKTSGSVDFVVLNASVPTSTGDNVLLFGDTNLGRVSIGNKSPMAKLHITSTQSNVPLIIASGSTTDDLVRITQRGTGNALLVEDIENPDSSPFVIDNVGNVSVGLTGSNAKLHVRASSGATGSTVLKIDGNAGELFTVTDSLTGSLMSVNDISGLPILEVFDDNTILMGNYQAPSLYSSTKSIVGIVTNTVVYQFVASSYTSAFFEYNVQNSTNLRAGTITAVWNSSTMQFNETSTMDIGSTSPITFDVVLTTISTVVYVQLRATTTTSGWTIKSIIRTI